MSSGTNTYAGMPTFAACAAVAFARFPVEAHPIASNPNTRAIVIATETTRSLNGLERAEVLLADRQRLDRVPRLALSALERHRRGELPLVHEACEPTG